MTPHKPRKPFIAPSALRRGGGLGLRGLVTSLALHGGVIWAAFYIGWGGQGNGGADLVGMDAGAESDSRLSTLEMQISRPQRRVPDLISEPLQPPSPAKTTPRALQPRQLPPAVLRPLARLTVPRPSESLTLPESTSSTLPASMALPAALVAAGPAARKAENAEPVRQAKKGDSGRASGRGGQGRAGDATFSSAPPRLISAKPPVYPSGARRAGAEGIATVRVSVSATGKVLGCAIYHSAGREDLDAAALKAVRGWEFQPGRQASGAVAADVLVRVVFRLA